MSGWIRVEDRLPQIGQTVEVRGQYVAPNSGFPIATRVEVSERYPSGWSSVEWRGQCGVTHWLRR